MMPGQCQLVMLHLGMLRLFNIWLRNSQKLIIRLIHWLVKLKS